MNESWRVVLQGDALAALVKYREKQANEPTYTPGQPVPVNAEFERIGRAMEKRRRKAAKRRD